MVFHCLFESFVRIKRTVKPNRNTSKVTQDSVTWPLRCPCSQTNLALWGILQRHFVSIAFSPSLSNCSFVLGYFSGKSGFFGLACMEVDGLALNPHIEHIVFSKWNMTDLPPACIMAAHPRCGGLLLKVLQPWRLRLSGSLLKLESILKHLTWPL